MKIESIDYKGKKIIAITGDIDMYSSPELRDEMMAHIRKKATALYIDLKSVTYIDSSGIATFVEGLKCMKLYGGNCSSAEYRIAYWRSSDFRNLTGCLKYTARRRCHQQLRAFWFHR